MELVDEADKDKNGKIDFGEWEYMGLYHHNHSPSCRVLTVNSHQNKGTDSNG